MNKKSLLSAFLSLLLSSMLLVTYCSATPAHAAASWNVQTVDADAAGTGNGYCPIAVDSNNNPHIAYTNLQGNDFLVMYAAWTGSGWNKQEIANGFATDFALDNNNNPHILYETGVYGGLMYASWTGLKWDIQTVNTNRTVYASLALDSSGNPHAAYSDGTSVKYASRNGSTWTIQTVDTGTEIPFQVSLALDSNDNPQILYSPGGYPINVSLAVWTSSGWNIQTAALNVNWYCNLVLDSKGQPHFVYGGDLTTIMYASLNGAVWIYQPVVSGIRLDGGYGIGFLALDSLDYPHISYVTAITAGSDLMYAAWTGANWNIQSVDTDFVREPIYLAVDSNRIPHISYLVGYLGPGTINIKYATATEPVPLSSPTPILPLLLVATAVIIGAVITVVAYVWKKKTQSQSK